VESSPWAGKQEAVPLTATVSLIAKVPELRSAVPDDALSLAERVLTVPRIDARNEELTDVLQAPPHTAFGFLVAHGVVLKETTFAARSALELLGPGDVLAPPLTAPRQIESRAVSRYLAHGEVVVAVLDGRFRQAARRWPGLLDVLHDRLGQQTHRASMHLAMLHLPRAEDRILALFSDLAERFGRVTGDGVVIDVALTHDVIGRLVGSRRPTVSLALGNLAAEGLLSRWEGERWKLARTAVT
jgi:CRP/FNR family cyclic AMP-dependent transcriptional regulator